MNDAIEVFHELAASPDLFREHIQYTARRTGFRGELVEKDFYCSVVLNHLAEPFRQAVVFKGGTCLSKVHTRFYRLSEDLDFAISLPVEASRTERSGQMEAVKRACQTLVTSLPGLHELARIKGANQSKQYIGTWGYRSVVSGEMERVKIEISLREPLLLPAEDGLANTLLQSAITEEDLVTPFPLRVIALRELWAEKIRAALSRRDPAIRDFFDLDYASKALALDLKDKTLLGLVREKLAVPSNNPVDVSGERRRQLDGQVEGQLRPVLRKRDFTAFDLHRIWLSMVAVAERL
jgi:predicted nucleotidyltransferase component of viral defense system